MIRESYFEERTKMQSYSDGYNEGYKQGLADGYIKAKANKNKTCNSCIENGTFSRSCIICQDFSEWHR